MPGGPPPFGGGPPGQGPPPFGHGGPGPGPHGYPHGFPPPNMGPMQGQMQPQHPLNPQQQVRRLF
jgi:hypothetical protein